MTELFKPVFIRSDILRFFKALKSKYNLQTELELVVYGHTGTYWPNSDKIVINWTNPIIDNYFKKNGLYSSWNFILLHETMHAIQTKKGKLTIQSSGNIKWNGLSYINMNIPMSNDDYNKLPWEAEANNFALEWENKCNYI